MPRPSNALREFVKLYTTGPDHLKGQWEKCAVAAGMKYTPKPDDVMVQRMLRMAGPPLEAPPRPEPIPVAPAPVPAILGELEAVVGVLEEEKGIDWKRIRSVLQDTIESIATGEVRPSAAQVAMIKFVTEKAELQAKKDDTVTSVVVLPTQGTGAETVIDEQWMKRIRKLEGPGDAKG